MKLNFNLRKFFGRSPDWLFYGFIVAMIYLNASMMTEEVTAPPPPPSEMGPLLPSETPKDELIITQIDVPKSGSGTAFSISSTGGWLSARHVVDSCDEVALKIGRNKVINARYEVFEENDLALLQTEWKRNPIPNDVQSRRQVGELGYFMGFPQGQAGEAVGRLIARNRMLVRGRYTSDEGVLAWAEIGRTNGLKGSLGGLSGAPVLDQDGEIIGVVTAENPRRGRIYSVAPEALRPFFLENSVKPDPIRLENYGLMADKFRRDRRIAQVFCLVEN